MKKKEDTTLENGMQYDAFISYRHTEPDSYVAQTLHKCLESFKLPRSVVRLKKEEQCRQIAESMENDAAGYETGSQEESISHDTVGIKTRIHRVFRDREELPLVSNLADPITEALEQSEFLIVICSPRLNESMWCRKEIETFIQMHDREHVLAVLAEGEPETSFPEELLYREEEELQSDGSVAYKKVPVEPLAADVRGRTHREIRKKIRSELLRLAAPMFDCNYDDLRQRHKEQKMRKTILTSVSVSVVCLLIGLVSTIMALKIQHQSQQIQYQSQQIEKSAQQIYEQSELIAAQNLEVSERIAEAQAREALSFLEEGDRLFGMAEAVIAYENWSPEKIYDGLCNENIYKPTTTPEECPSQLTYALTELLYLYENGAQIKPDRILEEGSTIRYMKLSPEGSRLMTVGDSGSLSVWESEDDRVRISIKPKGVNLSWESQVDFLSEDQILYPQEDTLCLQNIETEEIVTYPCDLYEGVIPIPEKSSFLVVEEAGCYLVGADGKASDRLQWDQLQEGLSADPGFEFAQAVTEDGRILAALELTGTVTAGDGAADTDMSAGSVPGREGKWIIALEYDGAGGGEPAARLYPVDYEFIGAMCLEDGSYQQGGDLLYVVSNHSEKKDAAVTTADMTGRLQVFDLSGQKELWTYNVHGGWLYDVGFAHRKDSSYLVCQKYSDVLLLDRRDGSLVNTFSFGSEVVKTGAYKDSEHFMAFTRDGVWHSLHTGRMEDMVGMTFVDCTSSNVKDFAIGDGYCVTLPYGSNCATVYRTARGEGLEPFHEGEGTYQQAKLSADGGLLAASRYDENSHTCVEMFDTAKKELLWTYEDDGYYETMTFGDFDGDGTESLLVITKGAYHIIDPADGNVISTVAFADSYMDYLGMDTVNGVICLQDYHTLYGYRIADGALLYEDELEDGVAAVCHGQPFYAVASKETDSLVFYQMGESEVFMDPGMGRIDVGYLETMFFDEDDDDLYLVYKDGRVVIWHVNWDAEDWDFCGIRSRCEGLSERMMRYEAVAGADFALLCGDSDAYQIDLRKDQLYRKLSHIHGYLAYDAASGTLYLHNGKEIYTSPLYSIEEIVDMAQQVLSVSSHYWSYREFVPHYMDNM